MNVSTRYAGLVLILLALSGCRQPDGPVPTPAGDDPDRIQDIVNNLDNVSRGDPTGPADLADDLSIFVQEFPAASGPVSELARTTAAAFQGVRVDEEPTATFANQLWLTLRARELSERQVESLQGDVQSTLTGAGIAADRATAVSAQVGEVQRAINARPRRWYQLF